MIHSPKEKAGLWSLSEAAKYGFALPHWWLGIQLVKALFTGRPLLEVQVSAAWFLVALAAAPIVCVLGAMALNHYVRRGEAWARQERTDAPPSRTFWRKDRERVTRRKRLSVVAN